ncbi:MAG: hypothetical protein IPL79_08905 [Myxococcales bacterium]|nr:hypothetical protein [Myxococcales bacterium]
MKAIALGLGIALVTLIAVASRASASEDDAAPAAVEAEASATVGDPTYWSKALPLHPKVVHIPIALCIVMPLVVLATLLGFARGWFSPGVWALAVMLQAIQLGGAVMALQTGEDDEKVIEGYASDEAIHRHEEAAERFTFATGGTLALLAATWALRNRRRVALGLAAASLIGTAGVAYAGYVVGDAGGRLVYISGAADAHK